MKHLVVGSLFLTVATLLVIGGLISAPFLFGLFLLALADVLGELRNRTVRVHNSSMNTRRWRDGS